MRTHSRLLTRPKWSWWHHSPEVQVCHLSPAAPLCQFSYLWTVVLLICVLSRERRTSAYLQGSHPRGPDRLLLPRHAVALPALLGQC